MSAKKPTAAQLAARKLFAQRARAGTLKHAKKTVAKKASVKRNPSNIRTRADITRAHVRTAARYLAQLVEEGYTFKQAEAIAIKKGALTNSVSIREMQRLAAEILRKPNPRGRSKKPVTRASQATGKRPTKRLVTRRQKTQRAPRGYYANPTGAPAYLVHEATKAARTGHVAHTEAEARKIAHALADHHQVPFSITRVVIAVR